MKYIGGIILILTGILIIGLSSAMPNFTFVDTNSSQSVTYSVTEFMSSEPANPEIFLNSYKEDIWVRFQTNYIFDSVRFYDSSGHPLTWASVKLTIYDYTAHIVVGSYKIAENNIIMYKTNKSITEVINGSIIKKVFTYHPYYSITVIAYFIFNNPNPGKNHIYEFFWTSTLHYAGTIGPEQEYVNGTISASATGFGEFMPKTVYPGYFILQNCTSSWKPTVTYYLDKLDVQQIDITIPPSQDYAYLNFIYVEYNASGNTFANFVGANIIIKKANEIAVRWVMNNSTTYNNYPALYMHIKLPPGKYTIQGYAVYNTTLFWWVKGNRNMFDIVMNINVKQSSLISIDNNQIINYLTGSLLIVIGAIDIWRWHI
jgi:hypothetical protein